MEFRFNINPLFKANVAKVNHNLIPQGFSGDRRQLLETTTKMTEIVNAMGEASALAQGLNNPVTTAQKLRNSDHSVYLLTENNGKNSCVTGLLKVGTKNLYVFDPNGETQQILAPCVLDFYIHESRQRSGLGKKLFEYMLEQESYHPSKMAIDRPSEKLLGFLRKHYDLDRTIPQMNNFVVYEGFFGNKNGTSPSQADDRRVHITASPNTALFGPHVISDNKKPVKTQQNSPSLPCVHNQPMGRFGAPRPMCSMAEIIHSSPTPISGEPNSHHNNNNHHHHHFVHHHTDVLHQLHYDHEQHHDDDHYHHHHYIDEDHHDIVDGGADDDIDEKLSEIIENVKHIEVNSVTASPAPLLKEVTFIEATPDIIPTPPAHAPISSPATTPKDPTMSKCQFKKPQPPNHFPLSKQHTGMKNISFNVGAAVSPTDKMEFVQEVPESFGLLKINQPIGGKPHKLMSPHSIINTDLTSPVPSVEGLTDQGYFDLKFYHNKLW